MIELYWSFRFYNAVVINKSFTRSKFPLPLGRASGVTVPCPENAEFGVLPKPRTLARTRTCPFVRYIVLGLVFSTPLGAQFEAEIHEYSFEPINVSIWPDFRSILTIFQDFGKQILENPLLNAWPCLHF
jgi:hypothetical protein